MGSNPNKGEIVAYFAVVIFLVAGILSSTYYYLWRRNKKIKNQQPVIIGLTSQHRRAQSSRDLLDNRLQPLPLAHIPSASRNNGSFFREGPLSPSQLRALAQHNRGFFRERPDIFTHGWRHSIEDDDNDFTAQWAREQASSNAYRRSNPLTIYPESSISSVPRRPYTHPRDYPAYPRRTPPHAPSRQRPSLELQRSPPPPTPQQQQHFFQPAAGDREDVSSADEDFIQSTRRLSYTSLTPPRNSDPESHGYAEPTEAAQHYHEPHRALTSHLTQNRAPSHHRAPSQSHSFHLPTISSHIPPTPSTVSPPTDIAACVNPYYLSSQQQSRLRDWSIFGLGSEASSSVGQQEWVVQGRAAMLAQESPTPAPLSFEQRSRSHDDGDVRESHGGGKEMEGDGEDDAVLESVAYRAGGRF
ncbi:MAG: hypothetical protein Q9191_000080 [Dirinaria sp. TL-2023a]